MKQTLIFVILLFTVNARALTVTDFLGKPVTLETPAKRIVALAPHIVENIFSAGGGDAVIGVVEHCDFPEQAKSIPRLGSMGDFGLESIVNLQPDLVVIWHTGKGGEMYSKLIELGITTYASGPKTLEDIAKSVRDFGVLTGNEDTAEEAVLNFEKKLASLKSRHADTTPVPSFYQVWDKPILTINRNSMISDVITLCGGTNAFGDAPSIVPKLSVESVISANPTIIFASGMADERPQWLDDWKQWPSIDAVKHGNLFYIPPDIIQRHSLRILDGAEIMCNKIKESKK